jgi:hypothetical protein
MDSLRLSVDDDGNLIYDPNLSTQPGLQNGYHSRKKSRKNKVPRPWCKHPKAHCPKNAGSSGRAAELKDVTVDVVEGMHTLTLD